MATTKKTTKTSPSGRKAPSAAATKAAAPAPKKTAKSAARVKPAKQATATTKRAAAKTTAAPQRSTNTKKATTKRTAATKHTAPPAVAGVADGGASDHDVVPAPRGHTKDGIAYTKDFDAKFLKVQRDLLAAERQSLVGQADRLEDEANSLIEDGEMGDVQFDDESGEGDTMVVERERDLALSAQARQIGLRHRCRHRATGRRHLRLFAGLR